MSDMDLPLAVRMMQDGYLMEIDQLQTENAELRKERDALDHLTDVLNATNDGLIAENDKLRELVRRLYGSYYIEYPDGAEREFAGELRELGVEV